MAAITSGTATYYQPAAATFGATAAPAASSTTGGPPVLSPQPQSQSPTASPTARNSSGSGRTRTGLRSLFGSSSSDDRIKESIDAAIKLWKSTVEPALNGSAGAAATATAPTPIRVVEVSDALFSVVERLRVATLSPDALKMLARSSFLSSRIGALLAICSTAENYLSAPPPPPPAMPPTPDDVPPAAHTTEPKPDTRPFVSRALVLSCVHQTLALIGAWSNWSIRLLSARQSSTPATANSASTRADNKFPDSYFSNNFYATFLVCERVLKLTLPTATSGGSTTAADDRASTESARIVPIATVLVSQALAFLPARVNDLSDRAYELLRRCIPLLARGGSDELPSVLTNVSIWLSANRPVDTIAAFLQFTLTDCWRSTDARIPPASHHLAVMRCFARLIQSCLLSHDAHRTEMERTSVAGSDPTERAHYANAFAALDASLQRFLQSVVTAAAAPAPSNASDVRSLMPLFALFGSLQALEPVTPAAAVHAASQFVNAAAATVKPPPANPRAARFGTVIRDITSAALSSLADLLLSRKRHALFWANFSENKRRTAASTGSQITEVPFDVELHLYDEWQSLLSIVGVHTASYLLVAGATTPSLVRAGLIPALFDLLLDTLLHTVDSTWLLVGVYESVSFPSRSAASAFGSGVEFRRRADARRWMAADLFTLLPLYSRAVTVLYPCLDAAHRIDALTRIHARIRYIHGAWRWYNLHHLEAGMEPAPASATAKRAGDSKSASRESASTTAASTEVAALHVEFRSRYLTPLHNALFLSVVLVLTNVMPFIPPPHHTNYSYVFDTLTALEFVRVDFTAYRDLFVLLTNYARSGVPIASPQATKQQTLAPQQNRAVGRRFVHTFVTQFMCRTACDPNRTPTSTLAEDCFRPFHRVRYAQRPFVCSYTPPTVQFNPLPTADDSSDVSKSTAVAAVPNQPIDAAWWRRVGIDMVEVSRHYAILNFLSSAAAPTKDAAGAGGAAAATVWSQLSVTALTAHVLPFAYRFICVPLSLHNRTAHTLFNSVVTHVLTVERVTAERAKVARRLELSAVPRGLLSWIWSAKPAPAATHTAANGHAYSKSAIDEAETAEDDSATIQRSAAGVRLSLPYYLRMSLQHYPSEVAFESITEAYVMVGSTFAASDLFNLYAFRLLIDRLNAEVRRLVPADTLVAPTTKPAPPPPLPTAASGTGAPSLSAESAVRRISEIRAAAEADPDTRIVDRRSFTPAALGSARALLMLAMQLVQVFDYSLLNSMLVMIAECVAITTHLPMQQALCSVISGAVGGNAFDLRARDMVLLWFMKLVQSHKIIMPAPAPPAGTIGSALAAAQQSQSQAQAQAQRPASTAPAPRSPTSNHRNS